MSDWDVDGSAEARPIEVRVFRHGRLIHREWCESEEQASLVVDDWSEIEGVECEVGDLSGVEPAGEGFGEPVEADEREYRDVVEFDRVVADARRRD